MSDLITISSSVLPDSAKVVGFRGAEAISRPYEIEIFVTIQQDLADELDLADGIGAKAKLVLDRKVLGGTPFVFAGVLANLEIMHAFEGRILLRATLVPRLWLLGLSKHSRIFTKMKVPDIIKTVLTENGVTDFELRLGSYDVEEHVSQYRESDLDFISRWMEREGIFYFFEHSDEGEKLVLCDQRLYDDDPLGKPVRFYPQVGHDNAPDASLWTFKCRHTTLPASVRLKDYDYAKPSLNVVGNARVADNGAGEVSLYGERFFTPSAGEKLAKIRAEEMLAKQVLYRGTGTRLHLRPGYAFELDEHPIPSFNARYLTIEARHMGNQAGGLSHFRELTGIDQEDVYTVDVEAIPSSTQLRAESRTVWPRIYGYENGVVDGPADSEYAQIDDQGRYLCKFKYDESKLKGGKATTFVRMMQPHGGDIEGFHFPLRKGTEVVFSFMGGDCDRPVISGVVPNAVNPSAVTSANHTKNVIQTGARNRLEIEDEAGSEWIRLSTPYANTFINMGLAWPQHELNLNTNANAAITAQGAFDIAVGNPEPAPSGAGNMTVHVLNNLTTTVDNVDMRTTVSSGNAYLTVTSGTLTETIKGDTLRHIETGNLTIDVDTGDLTTNVKAGSMFTNVKTNATTTVNANTRHRSDGTMEHHSGGIMTIHTDGGSDMFIEANTVKIKSRANTEVDVTGTEWVVRHGDSHAKTFGNDTVEIVGNSNVTRHGNTTTFHQGLSSSTFIGAKHTLEVAASDTITVAAKLDLTAAIKLALQVGLNMDINFAFNFSIAPFKHDIKMTKLNFWLADVATTPTHTRMGGLASYLTGLFAVV
jgi:type VI secretion system secreted protein VgrG